MDGGTGRQYFPAASRGCLGMYELTYPQEMSLGSHAHQRIGTTHSESPVAHSVTHRRAGTGYLLETVDVDGLTPAAGR